MDLSILVWFSMSALLRFKTDLKSIQFSSLDFQAVLGMDVLDQVKSSMIRLFS